MEKVRLASLVQVVRLEMRRYCWWRKV